MNRNMRLLTGHSYYIFNRGNCKTIIFHERCDFLHFLRKLRDLLEEYPVALIAYCLMPDHFHLLMRQDGESGISELVHAFGSSLSKTYNEKYRTVGSLFQGRFRDSHVGDQAYLKLVARCGALHSPQSGERQALPHARRLGVLELLRRHRRARGQAL